MLTYGSVCSGIEAVSVAWRGLMRPLWFSEIEPFPCAVLAHHYPDIPNLGDMTALPQKIINREIPAPDVLVGGTPCQAFSIAGLRNSLDDERGNLTLTLIHILEAIDYVRCQDGKQPCVLLWENVPGVLSTKDNAFGHFLAGLAQEREPLQPAGARWANSGYVHSARTIAWRILDAQYFGVAQRRRRVFVVASARPRSVAQILIERKSLCGDIETGGSTEKNITAYTESSFGTYIRSAVGGVVTASGGALGGGSETLVVHGGQENILFDIAYRSDVVRIQDDDTTPTLTARMGTGGNNIPCIALAGNTIGRQPHNGGNGNGFDDSGVSYTLTATDTHGVFDSVTVRKLTPQECEKLQGFPPGYTQIPYRNKSASDCPDSPRYKAIGNSMAVPVIKWIGERMINYMEMTK
jgi:DNA (cytosine-5-)-methyltransferase